LDGVRFDKFLLISAGAVLGANARYWIGTGVVWRLWVSASGSESVCSKV